MPVSVNKKNCALLCQKDIVNPSIVSRKFERIESEIFWIPSNTNSVETMLFDFGIEASSQDVCLSVCLSFLFDLS